MYSAELQDAAGRAPDFAGHFVLASWGCGASCVMAAAIDSETGVVAWLPFTVCCWPKEIEAPLGFRRDSRLLIVRGSRDEKGEGTHFYAFDGKSFVPVGAEDATP